MADFEVTVLPIDSVEHHPNADRLDLAVIGGYKCIVGRDTYKAGDLVAYLPEASIVPLELLQELGLEGKLSGRAKNRVKAIRLRGVVSQGIVVPCRQQWVSGQDVGEELGITKFVPVIPAAMSGEVYAARGMTIRYDIENIKKYQRVIKEGEEVVFTEKIHGTWTMFGILPESMAHPTQGRLVVASKGRAARGLAIKHIDDEEEPLGEEWSANTGNLYVRVAKHLDMVNRVDKYHKLDVPVFILGESFGAGVQDLSYGHSTSPGEEIGFRVFDVSIGRPVDHHASYLNDSLLDGAIEGYGLTRVPVLYRGPFSQEVLEEHTNGRETVSGKSIHVREGVVVRPVEEREHRKLGRVQLKSVSSKYLLRKGNTTELE